MKKQIQKIILSKEKNILFVSGIILFGILAFSSLFTPYKTSALTYQTAVPVQFTFNPAISMNFSSTDLSISDLAPGGSSDSNIITIGVTTNNLYGYTLSATVGTKTGASTALTNTANSNYKFNNLSSAVSSLANIPNNNWGYSYSSDNGTTWVSGNVGSTTTGYAGLPLDNNDNADERGKGGVLLIDNDGTGSINSIKFKIGAKASTAQASGEYTNVINFYAVANPKPTPPTKTCSANKICYSEATLNNDVVGTMGVQSANANTSATLFASNFSRTGYGFAGWNTQPDYSGTFYGPNESITTPSDMSSGLSLYAVWVPSAGSMQSDASAICNALTPTIYDNGGDNDESTWSFIADLNSISALTDTRDGDTYAIARLTDGNCWMIENLRLDNTPELSSTNTNNPSLPFTNVYDTSSTSNHLSPTSTVAYDASTAPEGWCRTNSATCDDQSRIRTDNTANRVTYTTTQTMSTSANLYSYGNYYNWYSVTAGNGAYAKSSGVTDGDICPAGWHLPTGTGSGEFGLLSNSLGGYKNASNVAQTMSSSTTPTGAIVSKRLRHFPNNLLYSGYVTGASLANRGSDGDFWSSSAYSSNYAYSLYFYSSGVTPGTNSYNKYDGRAARCVVAPSS